MFVTSFLTGLIGILKLLRPKCKNCGRSAKWEVVDKDTGKKYYFCTKKCDKEYFKNKSKDEKCCNCGEIAKWSIGNIKDGKYYFCTKECMEQHLTEKIGREHNMGITLHCVDKKSGKFATSSDSSSSIVKSISDPKNRLYLIKEELQRLLEMEDGSYIVFENESAKKVVQFYASPKAKQLMLNVPIQKLSKKQKNTLNELFMPKLTNVEVFSLENPCEICITNDVQYAAEIADKIFLGIFELPTDYDLRVTLDSF